MELNLELVLSEHSKLLLVERLRAELLVVLHGPLLEHVLDACSGGGCYGGNKDGSGLHVGVLSNL